MWFRSVFVVMPRARAISAVLAPVDRARNTSRSRSVRRARRTLEWLPSVLVAREFGIAMTWRVPCASELAASQKSSGVASLATYPLAPACSADCTESALSNMVSTPIGTCGDQKSTRLNSSHSQISYAVFCLKKKNNTEACICYEDRGSRYFAADLD